MAGAFYKFIFLAVLPAALILFTFATYQYAMQQKLLTEAQIKAVPYDRYDVSKTKYWKNRFDFLQEKYYNQARRRIIGAKDNTLEVRRGQQKYVIYYEYQVDGDIIETVTEVTEEGDTTNYKGRYFLVKYQKFVEIVYFDLAQSKVQTGNQNGEKIYEAEVCLQLPVEITENVRYHIDNEGNIWIATLSMNKVVFVQIYSCIEGKLIKEYRYTLKSQEFINSLFRIVKKTEFCMHIQVITYGLNRVDLQLCPSDLNNHIHEVATHKTNDFTYTQAQASEWSSYAVISQQAKSNQFWKIVNNILRRMGIQFQFKTHYEPSGNPIEDIYQTFDAISIDQKNNYLINLSKNKTQTGIIAFDKYLINAKTPIFHGNPNYDPYGVLDLFDRQSKGIFNPEYVHRYLSTKLNQTKKISYKAAFPTVPNYKVEHIGFGDKALIFWPQQNLEDKDYLAIRTKAGALISQKTQFKGVHDKIPISIEQESQRLDDKPQEVYPGLYQFHAVQQSLISKATVFQRLQEYGKLELVSLLNGKTVFSHSIRIKQGFRYMSSFLLNNQWWIVEYNREKKVSQAKKYQFFFMSKAEKVYSLDMVYGNITSTEYQNGQDQLSALMVKFVQQYKNGYVFVNVYRCVDEYYYIEYTDADFKVYGVARIHFKNLSNRRFRKGRDYSQTFHKQVMVQDQNLAPSKYSLKSYAIALKNLDVFKHLKYFYGEKAVLNQTWTSYCNDNGENFRRLKKFDKYYYFPQAHYALGNNGCNYNSDDAQNQTILSLNMRNMIIQAKTQNRDLLTIRKNIIYVLLSIIPTYFVLIGICYAILNNRNDQKQSELQKQKGEASGKSAKEKKNN